MENANMKYVINVLDKLTINVLYVDNIVNKKKLYDFN